jgi:hypothetical protein
VLLRYLLPPLANQSYSQTQSCLTVPNPTTTPTCCCKCSCTSCLSLCPVRLQVSSLLRQLLLQSTGRRSNYIGSISSDLLQHQKETVCAGVSILDYFTTSIPQTAVRILKRRLETPTRLLRTIASVCCSVCQSKHSLFPIQHTAKTPTQTRNMCAGAKLTRASICCSAASIMALPVPFFLLSCAALASILLSASCRLRSRSASAAAACCARCCAGGSWVGGASSSLLLLPLPLPLVLPSGALLPSYAQSVDKASVSNSC